VTEFDWRAYLNHAFSTLQLPPQEPEEPEGEARRRSAVSRGYDALHNVAREYAALHMSFKADEADKAHWQLIKLMRAGSTEEKNVSQTLDEMRRFRNMADYDEISFLFSYFQVRSMLFQIQKAIATLEVLRKRREAAKR
jgi:hypothetical protein